MARKSPQTFQKIQRERRKQLKRQEKMERRLDRSEAKRSKQGDDESRAFEPEDEDEAQSEE